MDLEKPPVLCSLFFPGHLGQLGLCPRALPRACCPGALPWKRGAEGRCVLLGGRKGMGGVQAASCSGLLWGYPKDGCGGEAVAVCVTAVLGPRYP